MGADARYVCAFRGRRDYYQVPLALAEADLLDQLITDAYATPLTRLASNFLPRDIGEKIRARSEPGIPPERVTALWGIAVREQLRNRLGYSPSRTNNRLDLMVSLAAAARARKTRSNLYLYSPYAFEAFTAGYAHDPRKVMFQFHPHPHLERRILAEDRAKYPFVQDSFEEEAGENLDENMKRRGAESWRHADLVICASSFTERSLTEAGAPSSLCRIVPYGIDLPAERPEVAVLGGFHALFVGAGSQRKGLHHLLLAWQDAALPAESTLTLVCRHIDPGIEPLARRTPGVRFVRGASWTELTSLFRTSTLLVMPSLVEGFGLVYLEALAHGCPVLGTANTGLPDIADASEAICLIEPGRIDQLVAELEQLSRLLPGNPDIRQRARACASCRPWRRFRGGICATLQQSTEAADCSEDFDGPSQ